MKTKQKRFLTVGICVLVLLVAVGAFIKFGIIDKKGDEFYPVEIPLTDLAATYKGEIKDAEGNLLVPFDVAYPDAFASGYYKYEKDVLLLKLKPGFGDKINNNLVNCGFASIERFMDTPDGSWYEAKLAEGTDILVAIQKARSLSEVLVADFDYIYETESIDYENVVVNSPKEPDPYDCDDKVKENNLWKDQYNLGKNKVQEAWKYLEDNGVPAGGSSSVIVAVIDTGVDYNHPDLNANIWVNKAEIAGNGVDDDNNGYIDDVYGWAQSALRTTTTVIPWTITVTVHTLPVLSARPTTRKVSLVSHTT